METSKSSNATACSLEITVDHRTFVWISLSKKCPLCIQSRLVLGEQDRPSNLLSSYLISHINCKRSLKSSLWQIRITALPSADRVKLPTFPFFTNCWSSLLYHVNLSVLNFNISRNSSKGPSRWFLKARTQQIPILPLLPRLGALASRLTNAAALEMPVITKSSTYGVPPILGAPFQRIRGHLVTPQAAQLTWLTRFQTSCPEKLRCMVPAPKDKRSPGS